MAGLLLLLAEDREGTVVWRFRARWAAERCRGSRDEVRVRRAMSSRQGATRRNDGDEIRETVVEV